jgi:hypothetical protein
VVQIEFTRKAARQVECDEDDVRFKEKLGEIARARPPEKTAGKPKP